MNTATITIERGIYTGAELPFPGAMKPAYGTGGYRELLSDCNNSVLCFSRGNWWTMDDIESDDIKVIIHQGDVDTIKALIKAEFEHFDVTVEFKS